MSHVMGLFATESPRPCILKMSIILADGQPLGQVMQVVCAGRSSQHSVVYHSCCDWLVIVGCSKLSSAKVMIHASLSFRFVAEVHAGCFRE